MKQKKKVEKNLEKSHFNNTHFSSNQFSNSQFSNSNNTTTYSNNTNNNNTNNNNTNNDNTTTSNSKSKNKSLIITGGTLNNNFENYSDNESIKSIKSVSSVSSNSSTTSTTTSTTSSTTTSSSSSSSSSNSSNISYNSNVNDTQNTQKNTINEKVKNTINENEKNTINESKKNQKPVPYNPIPLPRISDVELKTLGSVLKRKKNESILKNYLITAHSGSPLSTNTVTFGPSALNQKSIPSSSIASSSKKSTLQNRNVTLSNTELAASSLSQSNAPSTSQSSDPFTTRLIAKNNRNDAHEEKLIAKAKKAKVNQFDSGAFTFTEREKVKAALDQFLTQHDVPKENLHYLIHSQVPALKNTNPYSKTDLVKNFSQRILEIADINRSARQLYFYLRNAYSYLKGPLLDYTEDYKRKDYRWTPEQDQALLYHVTIWGTSRWKKFEQESGMFGAKDRYDCLQSKKLGHWTAKEDLDMYHAVREIMDETGITDPTKFNSFTLLASRMGGMRTYREVSRHFKVRPPSYWLQTSPDPALPSIPASDVPVKFRNQKKQERITLSVPSQWSQDQFIDLLTRMIFHFPDAKDESELKWKEMINSSDVVTPHTLQTAWRHIVLLVASRWDVEEMSLGKVVQTAMDHIKELVP